MRGTLVRTAPQPILFCLGACVRMSDKSSTPACAQADSSADSPPARNFTRLCTGARLCTGEVRPRRCAGAEGVDRGQPTPSRLSVPCLSVSALAAATPSVQERIHPFRPYSPYVPYGFYYSGGSLLVRGVALAQKAPYSFYLTRRISRAQGGFPADAEAPVHRRTPVRRRTSRLPQNPISPVRRRTSFVRA